MEYRKIFLLLVLVTSFYNIGVIWLMEVEIFPSWKLMDFESYKIVRGAHWKNLPFAVFIPAAITLVGSIGLLKFHPYKTPSWTLWIGFAIQLLTYILTGFMWGRWQAELTFGELGPDSDVLNKLLSTHWIRTMLLTGYGLVMFWATVKTIK